MQSVRPYVCTETVSYIDQFRLSGVILLGKDIARVPSIDYLDLITVQM